MYTEISTHCNSARICYRRALCSYLLQVMYTLIYTYFTNTRFGPKQNFSNLIVVHNVEKFYFNCCSHYTAPQHQCLAVTRPEEIFGTINETTCVDKQRISKNLMTIFCIHCTQFTLVSELQICTFYL